MNTNTNQLKEEWTKLSVDNPRMRIRNAAAELGVSEAELLITNIGEGVTILAPQFAGILTDVEVLGKVMALTRNNECVHERKGIYKNADFSSPHAQLFVGEDIDLRIFLSHWKYAFAVIDGDKRSLQFFGKDGLALHKIYLTKDSNVAAYDALVEKYRSEDQFQNFIFDKIEGKTKEIKDAEVDQQAFQQAWSQLKDTHDFFSMTRKFGVSRTQALRLASKEFVTKISKDKVEILLQEASKKSLPIMVFVGNRGIIQIHTGEVKNIVWHNNWINVLDPDFNLHLDNSEIAEVYVVKKPTVDGLVHAVEVFNKNGDFIVQFFGKRKPGIPELDGWKTLVEQLENK